MRRFSDDALLQCLTLAIAALFIAWGSTLIKSWLEVRDARKEAKEDRDIILKKLDSSHDKLRLLEGRLAAAEKTIEWLTPETPMDKIKKDAAARNAANEGSSN